ncbi:unnamed protein product [Candida parapsilosis]
MSGNNKASLSKIILTEFFWIKRGTLLESAYTNDNGAQENDASRYTPGHNSPTPPFLKNTSSPVAYAYFSITREFQQYGLTNKFEL